MESEPGRERPFLTKTGKRTFYSERQRWEFVERTFDRSAGTYEAVYTDMETGKVVFRKQGPIDDQDLHGPESGRFGTSF